MGCFEDDAIEPKIDPNNPPAAPPDDAGLELAGTDFFSGDEAAGFIRAFSPAVPPVLATLGALLPAAHAPQYFQGTTGWRWQQTTS